jgi:co-chaperonin GroES (HSP10)
VSERTATEVVAAYEASQPPHDWWVPIRPIGPRVLVRPVYPEPDPSAIVLANPDDPTTADVLAVGEPRCKVCGERQTLSVAPGMRVTLRPEAMFHEVTVGGETLWLVPIDDVVAEVLPEG